MRRASHRAALEMQGQGLNIQCHPPAASFAGAHCRKENLGPVLSEHPTQPATAFAHAEVAELRQAHRPRLLPLANTNRRSLARAPVPQSKGLPCARFALELRKPGPLSLMLPLASRGESLECATQIDRRFFEHLLAHLCPPDEPRSC